MEQAVGALPEPLTGWRDSPLSSGQLADRYAHDEAADAC